ncbi:GPALPP motifs-containing protein 1 isoform X2 [Rhipicephalus microplus]|uniref:GPALPP motifs-containing protein 1 isoform X2 n=1 Tax=Rhipicephalus microplus TaxID=6941 RepID=UPI003F6D69EB
MSTYGPELPKGFKTKSADREDAGESGESTSVIGPVLPPGFKNPGQDVPEPSGDSKSGQDLYGPRLPPGFAVTSPKPSVIGPVLPPGFSAASQQDPAADSESDDSDDVIGPMPSEAVGDNYTDDTAARDFDRRATNMKRRLEGKDSEPEPRREEWMTELPNNMGLRIGLGARTFRKNMEDPTADRSAWTDTPADKVKKAEKSEKDGDVAETSRHRKRHHQEKELEEQLRQYNKEKRAESLLDMHRKKKKEQKKNEVKERREFNRDEDLKISRIDPRASKALINSAAFLNTKFSAGERKFL